VTGVYLETRGQAPIDRLLVLVAAAGFAPVVHELLLLGQISFPLAATVFLVARRPDGYRNGIPLGIALVMLRPATGLGSRSPRQSRTSPLGSRRCSGSPLAGCSWQHDRRPPMRGRGSALPAGRMRRER
jgi:hypothetical protein